MLASEIEHALMVQYLYAGLSLTGQYAATVNRIAVQEMGHLITLQNLILALTGTNDECIPALIHLGRDGLRASSDLNPLPFNLEPVTHATLAKFVVVERPEEIPNQELRQRLDDLEREATKGGQEPNSVFALYAAIRWLFQASDHLVDAVSLTAEMGFQRGWHVSDDDFQPNSTIDAFASTTEEWTSPHEPIVAIAHNREEAVSAIDKITAQGEGPLPEKNSHFAEFLALLDTFEANESIVNQLPATPYIADKPPSEALSSIRISNPYTRLWAALFNIQYELLLIDIAWAISQRKDSNSREPMIDLTIREMKILRILANHLAEKPLDEAGLLAAGPTYELADESIPATVLGFNSRFHALVSRQRDLVEHIRSAPEFGQEFLEEIWLEDIVEFNDERSNYLRKGD